MKTLRNEFPDFRAIAKDFDTLMNKQLPQIIGNTAQNFFTDSFQRQGFIDRAFVAWRKRKDNTGAGRGTLVKSGDLRRSVRIIEASANRIVVGSDTPYSKIHNEGGEITIPITEKSKAYFWAMFKATNNPKYKAMAMTKKKEFKVTLPQRQFIGTSFLLDRRIEFHFKQQTINLFKNK